MKLSRILATGAAVALIGASTFALAGTASAAPAPTPGVDYVTAGDFVPEVSPYPHQWFIGDVGAQGTITSGVSGLAITSNKQLLNGDTPTTGLANLVSSASFTATGPAAFQISLFSNWDGTGTGFTTLVPDVITPDALALPATTWHTTQTIQNSDGTTAFEAGDSATIAEFATTLDAETTPYVILAYGVFVGVPFNTVLHTIRWNGVTTSFMPVPDVTVTPATITPADLIDPAKGVTATFSGFIPGETVQFGVGRVDTQSGDDLGTAEADETGSVTLTYAPESAPELGDYVISAFGVTSNAFDQGQFTLAAAAVTPAADPAAPALAVTGVDAMPYLVSGGILVLLGIGFGAVALRRRHAA